MEENKDLGEEKKPTKKYTPKKKQATKPKAEPKAKAEPKPITKKYTALQFVRLSSVDNRHKLWASKYFQSNDKRTLKEWEKEFRDRKLLN